MRLKNILSGSPDEAAFKALNIEAFPAEERMDSDFQLELSDDGIIEIVGIYDDEAGDSFVGFATVRRTSRLAYIFFLAIDSSARSKGYGSRALELLRERYSGLCLVLDIEPVGTGAENEEMRVRRRNFYLRCGFVSSAHTINYLGMTFEILRHGAGDFSITYYQELIDGMGQVLKDRGVGSVELVVKPM